MRRACLVESVVNLLRSTRSHAVMSFGSKVTCMTIIHCSPPAPLRVSAIISTNVGEAPLETWISFTRGCAAIANAASANPSSSDGVMYRFG